MDILKKRHDILSLIKTTSEEQGIQDYFITNVSKNQAGEGLLSEFFTATIKDNVSGKQLDFAIKVAFAEDKVRKTVPIRRFFENEVNFYSKVHPMLQKFERDRGISDNLQLIPKCFNVCIKDCSEMLILENLKVLKFECFDKTSFLDHEHISLIFKTYGRFHAYSFALRDQQPEEYQQLVGRLHNVYEECLNNENSTFQDYVRQNVQLIRQYLIPGEDDEVINKFRKYENNGINDILLDIVTEKCDYSAILHGDCWSNNMMFKYEKTEDGKKLEDIRLIDWQVIKVGSPVCDLSYCLYSGTSKDVFGNLKEYLKIYYESFSSFLKKLGSDPEKLFPFEVLKKHWKKYAKFGMCMAFGILKVKMMDKNCIVDSLDGLDANEAMTSMNTAKINENKFKKTIRELLHHLCEIDAL